MVVYRSGLTPQIQDVLISMDEPVSFDEQEVVFRRSDITVSNSSL